MSSRSSTSLVAQRRPVGALLVEKPAAPADSASASNGEDFLIECPTGSGKRLTLHEVSRELSRRLAGIFLPDQTGRRPCHGDDARWAKDPHWRDLVLFHEYFHGENGQGLGAGHQTGWTALVIRQVEDLARHRKQIESAAAVA